MTPERLAKIEAHAVGNYRMDELIAEIRRRQEEIKDLKLLRLLDSAKVDQLEAERELDREAMREAEKQLERPDVARSPGSLEARRVIQSRLEAAKGEK